MALMRTMSNPITSSQPSREQWEAPAIVLERSLEVSAQDGAPPPALPGGGCLGPLGVSGHHTSDLLGGGCTPC
jgi:hypothetical protein